jgi:hypothetical protein
MSILLTSEEAETRDHTFTGPIRIANAVLKEMSREELDAALDETFAEIREHFHLWREVSSGS